MTQAKPKTASHGYVVMRRDAKDKTKAKPCSGYFLAHAAAQEYMELCKKQGWDVFISRG